MESAASAPVLRGLSFIYCLSCIYLYDYKKPSLGKATYATRTVFLDTASYGSPKHLGISRQRNTACVFYK